MRNLADCLIQLLHAFATVVPVVETAAATSTTTQIRQPRSKANHKPFLYVERLKENLFHQFERFTKRFEDFDFRLRSIHECDLEPRKHSGSTVL